MKKTIFILIISIFRATSLLADGPSLRDVFPVFDILKPDDRKALNDQKLVKKFCADLDAAMQSYKWQVPSCHSFKWQVHSLTSKNNPLVYTEIGQGNNVTLIFSGVHPDELNPIPVAMRLLGELTAASSILKNRRIVVAPLVNPDGFFTKEISRTNAQGVDLNRNFNTLDWFTEAHDAWTKRDRRARYFPGWLPNSEKETVFQTYLIEKFQPQKILSLHAPLGIIDYDLDYSLNKGFENANRNKLKKFASEIAKKTNNYRIIDFNVFPGSLGNYAGVEKNIPTFTIELTDADPNRFENHWQNLHKGLLFAVSEGLKLAENRPSENMNEN